MTTATYLNLIAVHFEFLVDSPLEFWYTYLNFRINILFEPPTVHN